MEIKGLYTAIVTPFDREGNLDLAGLSRNIEFQIENKVDGIVPVGTTGESATLSADEHKKVIETTIEKTSSKVKTIAGTGSNNTQEAIEYTRHAYDAGADAALMITPYYNKPTQEGIYQHYKKIAQSVDIPIILYTVPGRTNVNIEPETLHRLTDFPNIIGIKDASGDLNQITREIQLCKDDFSVVSGEDFLNYPIISLGGKGAISVASNVAPALTGELVRSALEGDMRKAKELHYRLYELNKTLFIETNPAPVKAAMEMMGLAAGNPRLPLVPVMQESKERIKQALSNLDLL